MHLRQSLAMLALPAIFAGCSPAPTPEEFAAVSAVASALDPGNKLDIRDSHLAARANSSGDGVFVYLASAPTTRPALWLHLDGKAYCMNSPAGMITPRLQFARPPAIELDELRRRGVPRTDEVLSRFYKKP